MRRLSGATAEEDTTPTRQDVHEFESVAHRERSKSVKRRTTPLAKASPPQGGSERSVAFRPPPHGSAIILKYGRPKGSERDGQDPTHKAIAKITSQKPSPGPGLVPSQSTVNQNSGKKSGRRSRNTAGELSPDSPRIIKSREGPAAEMPSKRESPAPFPTSRRNKRTVNSKKLPSGDDASHELPQPTGSVAPIETEKSSGATLSVVERLNTDLSVSHAIQHKLDGQVSRICPQLAQQLERNDEQPAPGSRSKGEPNVPMMETLNRCNPINNVAGTKVFRSATCTGNDSIPSVGEANMPPHDKKMTIKAERVERTTSSHRLDRVRGRAPTPQPSEVLIDKKESSGISSEVVAQGMKTVAAAMVAEQTLRSNVQGGFVTEHAIDLLSTVSESQMEQCMRRHLKVLHDNHEYFMKVSWHHSSMLCTV